jgi:hypothetical protein
LPHIASSASAARAADSAPLQSCSANRLAAWLPCRVRSATPCPGYSSRSTRCALPACTRMRAYACICVQCTHARTHTQDRVATAEERGQPSVTHAEAPTGRYRYRTPIVNLMICTRQAADEQSSRSIQAPVARVSSGLSVSSASSTCSHPPRCRRGPRIVARHLPEPTPRTHGRLAVEEASQHQAQTSTPGSHVPDPRHTCYYYRHPKMYVNLSQSHSSEL